MSDIRTLLELFELETEYYTLSDGQMIQVSYRPALNREPLPGTMQIGYVDPKVKPTNSSTDVVKSWQSAPVSVKQAIVKWASSPEAKQGVAETKFSFANPKQKPGDQVRGTEKAKKSKDHPFKGRLVGAAESVEREIAEGWTTFLAELGADNTQSQDPATKQKNAKELTNITKAVSQAKTAGALPQNLGTTQAAQAIATSPDDIAKATTQQKKEMGVAGDSFNDFIKAASSSPAGQSALNTVLSAMKKVKSQPGT